jgi:hypothetical protein
MRKLFKEERARVRLPVRGCPVGARARGHAHPSRDRSSRHGYSVWCGCADAPPSQSQCDGWPQQGPRTGTGSKSSSHPSSHPNARHDADVTGSAFTSATAALAITFGVATSTLCNRSNPQAEHRSCPYQGSRYRDRLQYTGRRLQDCGAPARS